MFKWNTGVIGTRCAQRGDHDAVNAPALPAARRPTTRSPVSARRRPHGRARHRRQREDDAGHSQVPLSRPTKSTEHGGRTLLVTFNRCLVTYMRHLAGAIGEVVLRQKTTIASHEGISPSRDRLARGAASVAPPTGRTSSVALCTRHKQPANGTRFCNGLPRSSMKNSNGFSSMESGKNRNTLTRKRIGRVMARVTRADRAVVFGLYSRYLRATATTAASCTTGATSSRPQCWKSSVPTGEDRRYRHVVIDEGQDFSPEMLRSLAAAIPDEGSLTFFGDIAQQIYGHRMSWRSAGLEVRDVWRFRENYRNTRQISQLALALAAMPHFPLQPGGAQSTVESRYNPGRARASRRDCRCPIAAIARHAP